MTHRGRKFDTVIPSEMPRESLGRLRAALGLDTLLMDQAADQF
ncbi:MAG: hypothetical protein OXJ63_01180 [Gammaproteobacteria bacterium]|nr:hypothetical protein [Gammaproteobacteria bacterium]